MAEFKDISLFETITPTYANLANLYVQVSATEKVSLQHIAKQSITSPLTGFTTPTGVSAITTSDTVLTAIRKLAGRTLNAPCRLAWNSSRQVAIAFAKMGIVFSLNPYDCIIKVNPSPSYNLASDADGTIINGILGAGDTYEVPMGYSYRSLGSGNPSSVKPGELIVCGSNVSSISLLSSGVWSFYNSSTMIYLKSQQTSVPTIPDVSGINVHLSQDWNDVFGEAGIYVICLQYMYTESNIKHIAANVAKYQA